VGGVLISERFFIFWMDVVSTIYLNRAEVIMYYEEGGDGIVGGDIFDGFCGCTGARCS